MNNKFASLLKAKQQNTSGQEFLNNFVRYPTQDGAILNVRILPAANETNDWFISTRIHKINGRNVHCPREFNEQRGRWEGSCCICDYMANLWKKSERAAPDEQLAMQNEYRAIKPKPRFYANVIVRTEIDPTTGELKTNSGPKILSMSKQVFDVVCDQILSDPLSPDDVTDLATGKDFSIKIEKKGEWPDFSKSKFAPKQVAAGTKAEVATWMSNLQDLSKFRVVLDAEALNKEIGVHLGLIKDDFEMPPVAGITVTPTVEASLTCVNTETLVNDTSQGLADDDFLSELNQIGIQKK